MSHIVWIVLCNQIIKQSKVIDNVMYALKESRVINELWSHEHIGSDGHAIY
jgi:hypothetical protein